MKKSNNKYDFDSNVFIGVDEEKLERKMRHAILNSIVSDINTITRSSTDIASSIKMVYINDKKQEVGIKWTDGTITKGVCQDGDTFDIEIGFLMALKKKIFKSDKKLHKFILSKLPNDEKQIEIVNESMDRSND